MSSKSLHGLGEFTKRVTKLRESQKPACQSCDEKPFGPALSDLLFEQAKQCKTTQGSRWMKDMRPAFPWFVLCHPESGYPVIVYHDKDRADLVASKNGYSVVAVQGVEKTKETNG